MMRAKSYIKSNDDQSIWMLLARVWKVVFALICFILFALHMRSAASFIINILLHAHEREKTGWETFPHSFDFIWRFYVLSKRAFHEQVLFVLRMFVWNRNYFMNIDFSVGTFQAASVILFSPNSDFAELLKLLGTSSFSWRVRWFSWISKAPIDKSWVQLLISDNGKQVQNSTLWTLLPVIVEWFHGFIFRAIKEASSRTIIQVL